MKLTVFGLSVSSSWGNGHATLWRGLCRSLSKMGHRVRFFERDVPYYARHRDDPRVWGCDVCFYRDFHEIGHLARDEVRSADAVVVTSFCPDALEATQLANSDARGVKVFYDLDTPVTLDMVARGQDVPYLGPGLLRDFDLVLSFTGGSAILDLRTVLGAKRVVPLYGSVDLEVHRPVPPVDRYRAYVSYLGTYAADRQLALTELFLDPAAALPTERFVLGGAQYPASLAFGPNVLHFPHVSAPDHPSFFCSSRITINVTRRAMAEMGHCPSGRLFEAAACGVPILSDDWPGLDRFFVPGEEILVARTTSEALRSMQLPAEELRRVGAKARARVLDQHTSWHRARQLLDALESARSVVDRASNEFGSAPVAGAAGT